MNDDSENAAALAPPASSSKETGATVAKRRKHDDNEHPIAAAIDRFIHRARDTKLAARTYMPTAQRVRREGFDELVEEFKRLRPLLESDNAKTRVLAQKEATIGISRF